MSIKKISFYLQNANLLVHSDQKPLLKIFTGHTNNDTCNIWSLEAVAIPRGVKIKHIKQIPNIPAEHLDSKQ